MGPDGALHGVQTLLENHVIAVSESESNASTIHRANNSRQREHCNGGPHCLTSACTTHCNALAHVHAARVLSMSLMSQSVHQSKTPLAPLHVLNVAAGPHSWTTTGSRRSPAVCCRSIRAQHTKRDEQRTWPRRKGLRQNIFQATPPPAAAATTATPFSHSTLLFGPAGCTAPPHCCGVEQWRRPEASDGLGQLEQLWLQLQRGPLARDGRRVRVERAGWRWTAVGRCTHARARVHCPQGRT
jgi:hypothetical protein